MNFEKETKMSFIRFKKLVKEYNGIPAVKEIDLEIKEGEFVTFLGPSGCGKTTTLRCLSGLETPENGEIWVGDKCLFSKKEGINVPAGNRGLGLVFQNYALWPHMTVEQNIAFGLRKMKVPDNIKKEKIVNVLNAMGLQKFGYRYPHELSGGQQQRVALARMVVNEPGILLFDEPLSNLDAKLRMKLRSELKRLHRTLGATSIYVTHDQVEALALSDKIIVMKEGEIEQIGTPYEVYHEPVNIFVADFMGNPETNLLNGKIKTAGEQHYFVFDDDNESTILLSGRADGVSEGKEITINTRPEDIIINQTDDGGTFYVYSIQPMGSEMLIHIKSKKGGIDVIAKGPEDDYLAIKLEQNVLLKFKRGNIFDRKTGESVCSFKG